MTREERKIYNYWLTRREVNGKIEKQCSVCKEWKEENYNNFYYQNKSKPELGFTPECKICSSKRTQRWQDDNLEQYKDCIKKRNKNPSDKRIASMRKHAKRQKDRGYTKEYFNRPEVKARGYSKQRYQKNHRISAKEWEDCKHYFANRCAYCGLPIEEHKVKRKGTLVYQDLHKEHVIWNGKDNLKNCIPSCATCNDKKWKFTLNKWYNPKNPVYTYERYYKIYMWLRYDHKKYIQKRKPKQKYERKAI